MKRSTLMLASLATSAVLFIGGMFLPETASFGVAHKVDVTITGMMTPDSVKPVINAIKHADEETVVYVHINTQGGYYSTAVDILNAIAESRAKEIIMEVEGEAGSAGAMILLGATTVLADQADFILFHTPYYELNGVIMRDKEMVESVKAEFAANFCLDKILTTGGWEAFGDGKDVVMHGETFVKLNTKYNCWRNGNGANT